MNIDRDKLIEIAKESFGEHFNPSEKFLECQIKFAYLVSAHAITSMQTEQEPVGYISEMALADFTWHKHRFNDSMMRGIFNSKYQENTIPLFRHPAPDTSMQGDSEPEFCAASGAGCSMGEHGQNGEVQCEWCGKPDTVKGVSDSNADGWVSVEDRLPAMNVPVMVYSPSIVGLEYSIDEWTVLHECPVDFSTVAVEIGESWSMHEFEEVTHWKTLVPPINAISQDKGESV